MNKIYYLSSCSTCTRIIRELGLDPDKFEFQDIKTEKITPSQLDELARKAGSFEALFSRVALKYRALGLNQVQLREKDYREHILNEYTFLKRPVIVVKDQVFIGNAKKTIEAVKSLL